MRLFSAGDMMSLSLSQTTSSGHFACVNQILYRKIVHLEDVLLPA